MIKVDSLRLQDELGVVGGREPRWAIARKFAPDIAETRLLDIQVNVGRTGSLNPFAVLEAVEIGGTTVRLATLHNFDLIRAKDLRVGDVVQVKRAGDVIPQVIGPVPEKRDPKNPPKKIRVPTHCPSCGRGWSATRREVAIYCPNVACPGRQLEAIVHFASRHAMDIRGLSYARIEQLIAAVARARRRRPLRAHGRAAPRHSSDSPRRRRRTSSTRSPHRRRSRCRGCCSGSASGTSAQTAAQLLARHFGSMDALRRATRRRHPRRCAASARPSRWRSSPTSRTQSSHALVDKLARAGLTMTEPVSVAAGGAFKGMTFVVTGTLPTLSRAQATELIESQGGRVTSGVSKATTFLVVGADAGSKLDKARAARREDDRRRRAARRAGAAAPA